MLLDTRTVMNKPSKEINVFNTVHHEISHEEWQYNGWQSWPAILPQYCFSIIIAAPTPPFSTSLSLCHRPLLPLLLSSSPPLSTSQAEKTVIRAHWLGADNTSSSHLWACFKRWSRRFYILPSILAWCLSTKNTTSQSKIQYLLLEITSFDQDKEVKWNPGIYSKHWLSCLGFNHWYYKTSSRRKGRVCFYSATLEVFKDYTPVSGLFFLLSKCQHTHF